ncbi:hypothetical protein [Stakelama pacifica]|uniref:Uncharacterized protein n=1 Tax=Stakelama pacifica TaxID=517720 RepID=A0A4R6FMB6_9SPHN|nr:hypothetical protein [Stakelama pacifica]TDN81794.1 hypothetical protein EV664_107196 [Stakelama pacifica]GGO96589.1 hypothetical protein GCM10011329_23470 [Stakelama pacifica]
MKVFPTPLFAFESDNIDIEAQILSGGTSITGIEDVISTDGGGHWFAEFGAAYIDDPELERAYRACSRHLDGGTPMTVLFTDARAQGQGDIRLPIGGLPFWDESDFPTANTGAVVKTDAALRATQITITATGLSLPPSFGVKFTIVHPTVRARCYEVAEIVSISGADTTIKFKTPLREAVSAGTPVDFLNPRCVMRRDGAMPTPKSMGYPDGSVRFVEHFAESYS